MTRKQKVEKAERFPEFGRRDYGRGFYEYWYLDEVGGILYYVARKAYPSFDIDEPGKVLQYGECFYPISHRSAMPEWAKGEED